MKGHAVAQRYFQGAFVEPLPASRQARYHPALMVEFDEVLEDVKRHVDPVKGIFIDDAQLPLRYGGLFAKATRMPPQSDEQKNHTGNDEFVHDCPPLRVLVGRGILQLLAERTRIQAITIRGALPSYYTAPEATNLDQILTVLGRILTGVVRVGPPGVECGRLHGTSRHVR